VTPDFGVLAAIHAAAFRAGPRPWSADELRGFATAPGARLIIDARGFALSRVAADEAELATIAVAPDAWGLGVGAGLLRRALDQAFGDGAGRMFLEVGAGNRRALALYRGAGFVEAGRRRAYYRRADGAIEDALVMRCDLPAQGSPSAT
jgi:ribosomal-protein-alanine N-acetyltransferase